VPISNHKYRYGPGAIIQADQLKNLGHNITIKVLSPDNPVTIRRTKPNVVSVDVPLFTSKNLFPLTKNTKFQAAPVVQVYILNAAALTAVTWRTQAKFPGQPVNHPQRKKRGHRKITTQFFVFPGRAEYADHVCIVARTLHQFFEEDTQSGKVTFDQRRAIAASFDNVTVIA
jgi:hypothetical protein